MSGAEKGRSRTSTCFLMNFSVFSACSNRRCLVQPFVSQCFTACTADAKEEALRERRTQDRQTTTTTYRSDFFQVFGGQRRVQQRKKWGIGVFLLCSSSSSSSSGFGFARVVLACFAAAGHYTRDKRRSQFRARALPAVSLHTYELALWPLSHLSVESNRGKKSQRMQ
jgi:hypothetical protein